MSPRNRRFPLACFGLLAILLLVYDEVAAAHDLRIVAKSEDLRVLPSTSSPAGAELTSPIMYFHRYSMNNRGQVAYSASTRAVNSAAIFSEVVGNKAIAVVGQQAADMPPGYVFDYGSFDARGSSILYYILQPTLRLDDAGRTIFSGLVESRSSNAIGNAAGFWVHEGDGVSLIAAEYTQAPLDYAGMYFHQLGATNLAINNSPPHPLASLSATGGEYFAVAAQHFPIGASTQSFSTHANWLMDPDGIRALSVVSDNAGIPSTVLAANRVGDAAFTRRVQASRTELWRELAGVSQRLTDATTPVPGIESTGTPVTFATYDEMLLSDSGMLAFQSKIVGGGISTLNDTALVAANSAGELRTIVQEGTAAPGYESQFPQVRFAGGSFNTLPFRLNGIGGQDEVLFQATVHGNSSGMPDYNTLWIERDGQLTELLRVGDSLPGADGRTFGSIGSALINEQGLIVVDVGISSTQTNPTGGRGVFALAPGATEFTPIAVAGDLIPLGEGIENTLTSLSLAEVNDRGQILLGLRFNDGEAIVVSNQVATLSDFDGDGTVDGDDLAILKQDFGSANPTLATGDGDGNGVVDGADFLRWQREAMIAAPPAATVGVPEPSSLALLALAAFIGSCPRFRRQDRR